MFIWPDGQITGAEHWDALAWLVGEKPDESSYYANGRPSKDGWGRLEALLKEHVELVNPPQPEAAEEAAEPEPEPEAPKRRGRPPKEE